MSLNNVSALKCVICGKEYSSDQIDYVCPDHGNEGMLDVQYDYDFIGKGISRESLKSSRDPSIWRYRPMLPIKEESSVPPVQIGWTPLYDSKIIAEELGLKKIWIKDDGRQPTASLKDRASVMAIIKGREKGAKIITTASTGNAAAALSGLCASIQQPNVIFVPKSAPEAKIAQLLVFGSTVILVEGTYDNAFDLCMEAVEEYGWYNRNSAVNPYMTEGKKTVAYEICEQLNWKIPDRLFVSVGDGSIIGGLHKGLKDLKAMGWIDGIPKLMGVQATGSSYLYQAWKNDEDVLNKPAVKVDTIADSICSGLPRDRLKAMAAVKETDGAYICVSDDEILKAVISLARKCGVFAEPAGAAAYAGLVNAVKDGILSPDESVVVLNTGNGLKDISSAMKAVKGAGTEPHSTKPDLSSLKEIVSRL